MPTMQAKAWTGSRYPLDPTVDAVEVLLTTGGMPMNARIEILQGPDTNKQAGPGTHTEELVSHMPYSSFCLNGNRSIFYAVLLRKVCLI